MRKGLAEGSGYRPTTLTSARNGPRPSQGNSTGTVAARDSLLSQKRPLQPPTVCPLRSFIVTQARAPSRLQGLAPMRPTMMAARPFCRSALCSRTSAETAIWRRVQLDGLPLACSTVVVDPVVVDAETALFGERSASTTAKTTNATTAPTMTQVNRAGFNFVGTQARQEA